MKLKINNDTRLSEVAVYLDLFSNENVDELKKLSVERLFSGSFYSLKIGQFIGVLDGQPTAIFENGVNENDPTVFEYYSLLALSDFIPEFTKTVEKMTVLQTSDEQEASVGLPTVSMSEHLLFFCRSHFGLKSYSDVENMQLSEYILAKKEAYINKMYERKYNKVIEKKYRK